MVVEEVTGRIGRVEPAGDVIRTSLSPVEEGTDMQVIVILFNNNVINGFITGTRDDLGDEVVGTVEPNTGTEGTKVGPATAVVEILGVVFDFTIEVDHS